MTAFSIFSGLREAFASELPIDDTLRDGDSDGVSDAVEKELGLDPALKNIPEPLYFDMVRGLGGRRGELEINAVLTGNTRPGEELRGGPEVEYAFANGYGLEVELPISSRGIDAWKFGVQGTLPGPASGAFQHGWIVIGEYLLREPGGLGQGLYVAAYRVNRSWSALAMLGARVESRRPFEQASAAAMFKPSIFYDATARTTLGVELNSALEADGTRDLLVMPQVHWQPNRGLKIQAGGGPQLDEGPTAFVASLRISAMID